MNQPNRVHSNPDALTHRLHLEPIPAGTPRPLWSVMIPTHNCASYLRQTLAAVLAQAPGPEQMQIEVVDDCSAKDDPEAVVREVGRGRIGFYRQPKNVGHTRNFETCLQRACGSLVHQLHGDDYVRDGFYAKMEAAFKVNPDIGAAFCRTIVANPAGHWHGFSELERGESGVLENFAEALAVRQHIQTPSMVVKRAVYERLGGFDRRLSWTEDWEMWVRIAANYPIWFEIEPLAVYREHDNSSTQRKILTGENVRDIGRCLAITSGYFSSSVGARLRARASRHYAKWCIVTFARRLLVAGHPEAAWKQIHEALKLSHSGPVIGQLISFLMFAARNAGSRGKRRLKYLLKTG